MADNFERVQLEDDQVQTIAGGTLQYLATKTEKKLWSDEDPNTVYTFNKAIDIVKYLAVNALEDKPDSEQIAALLGAGLIW